MLPCRRLLHSRVARDLGAMGYWAGRLTALGQLPPGPRGTSGVPLIYEEALFSENLNGFFLGGCIWLEDSQNKELLGEHNVHIGGYSCAFLSGVLEPCEPRAFTDRLSYLNKAVDERIFVPGSPPMANATH